MTLMEDIQEIIRMKTNQLGSFTTNVVTDQICSLLIDRLEKMDLVDCGALSHQDIDQLIKELRNEV